MRVLGVAFDFDGTLTNPGALDFVAIRREIGCPEDQSIIHWIDALPEERGRRKALEVLLSAEQNGAAASVPRDGAEAFVLKLRAEAVPLAILTRNTRASLMVAFENFERLSPEWFWPIVTRDDPFPRKPDPEALLHIADSWGIDPSTLLFVGDYRDDVETAHRAGAISCWLMPGFGAPEPAVKPDLRCRSYTELSALYTSRC